jgi:membrane-associated phospholipid phosphatase
MSGDCDFRAPGWLARHATVAVLLVIIGGLLFGAMAYELKTNGPLVATDTALATRLHATAVQTASTTNETMTFGFFLGKEVLELIGVILVIYFLHKRFWPELGMVLIGWSGGTVIWFFITRYFDRARPATQMGIDVHYPSFPSGHTMQSMLCFGLLAYFLMPHLPSTFWKWVIAIAAVLAMLFVGASRVFQGGHYLSDVLAGYGLGLAWGAIIYTWMETYTLKRRVRSG